MAQTLSSPDFELMFLPPDSWVEVALDPARRSVQIAALAKTLKRLLPEGASPASYISLRKGMEKVFSDAYSSGVRYAIMPRIRTDGTVGMLSLYNIAILPAASLEEDEEEARTRIYQSVIKEREGFLEGESSQISLVENPSLGTGVQVESLEYSQTAKGKNTAHQVAIFRTFFPVKNQTVVATGVCFQPELQEVLFHFFELMTFTLSLRQTEKGRCNETRPAKADQAEKKPGGEERRAG